MTQVIAQRGTRALARCYNIADLRELARRRLPAPMFHFLDGGSEDESTLRHTTEAFEDYDLLPRYLTDVSEIDMSTRVLGQQIKWPVVLSPTGGSRLFHHQGERAVARAAVRAGTIYSLGMMGSVSIEDITKESVGPKMFQVCVLRDRGLTTELMTRCRAAGYVALCLTVDCPVHGNRERERRSGMPQNLTLRSKLSVLAHLNWLWHHFTSPPLECANFGYRISKGGKGRKSLPEFAESLFDPGATWDDAAGMIEQWGGPFAIKGILTVGDAERAIDIGASAIIVSNHGGRQFDGAVTSIEALPEIAQAVGDRCEVILDSGVRRGTHVLKALALGAKACMIGRPYLYGLSAGGEAGVDRALGILRSEVARGMAFLGCRSIAELDGRHIRPRHS